MALCVMIGDLLDVDDLGGLCRSSEASAAVSGCFGSIRNVNSFLSCLWFIRVHVYEMLNNVVMYALRTG
jgi:hypothetical protein